ncbi:hypothetical protein I302_108309 [Kwoniella bestiolae CBS 10118]|uniref:Uncharacterized protein n=1 Tax=Kwoniella bestiolae CBS 10118 TaxID=1296100 RepID=A0A1B9FW18_9TREE|nr:hypothetical protein I302_07322 [Kwoniella bestiolae CBS 10118]OCF22972.1 hypothetical protein I302_07322 [Kwoniella bestiolae CBS 10118]
MTTLTFTTLFNILSLFALLSSALTAAHEPNSHLRQHHRDLLKSLNHPYQPHPQARATPDGTAAYTPDNSLHFEYPRRNFKINSRKYKKLTKLLPKILKNANSITTHSWELGCFTETLLEVYNPALTPFEWDSEYEADGGKCQKLEFGEIPWNVLKIAKNSLVAYDWTGSPSSTSGSASQTAQNTSIETDFAIRGLGSLQDYFSESTSPVPHIPKALINGDGALGDPVSLVPAIWILAQFSENHLVKLGLGGKSAADYAWALGNQLDYLFSGIRAPNNNTISQREDHFELWADMMYMIPPSLSYLGLSLSSEEYMKYGLEQWSLETSALLDTTVNIYRHVHDWDTRLWATGNGWGVYGGIRNIYSAKASPFASTFSQEISQAEDTLLKIFERLFNELDDHYLIPNYMRQVNATLAVGDTAGTALTVAAYYRFVKLCPDKVNDALTRLAERAFDAVVAKIDKEGWVTHAVDPMGTYGWVVYPNDPNMHSPEAQAFAAKMWKARTKAGV